MSLKFCIVAGVLVGSMIGGYTPILWGDSSLFSTGSTIGNMIGGLSGIWAGVWVYNNYFN